MKKILFPLLISLVLLSCETDLDRAKKLEQQLIGQKDSLNKVHDSIKTNMESSVAFAYQEAINLANNEQYPLSIKKIKEVIEQNPNGILGKTAKLKLLSIDSTYAEQQYKNAMSYANNEDYSSAISILEPLSDTYSDKSFGKKFKTSLLQAKKDLAQKEERDRINNNLAQLKTYLLEGANATAVSYLYQANEFTYDNFYKNRTIVIKGKVLGVEKGMANHSVYLEGVGNVNLDCWFKSTSEIYKLQRGQIVFIKGECSGKWGNNIRVENCQIGKKNNYNNFIDERFENSKIFRYLGNIEIENSYHQNGYYYFHGHFQYINFAGDVVKRKYRLEFTDYTLRNVCFWTTDFEGKEVSSPTCF